MSDQVFGIDLGTTYSAIAYLNDLGQAEVIKNREGDDTTPSVVFFESDTNVVVGKEAKNAQQLYSETTVALIKRHMGTDLTLDFHGVAFRPESISALILKDLVESARENSGIDTNRVVITVPAYFGLAEKEATRQAGQIAGLEVIGIVTEPVAAALSVGVTGEQQKTIFVYDLGGGTFDCTIMQLSPGAVDVIVIDGSRVLGGADWDAKLFELINARFMEQAGLEDDPTSDENFAQDLMTKVEETKKTLSRRERAKVALAFGEAREQVEITRADFEEASRVLVDQTLEIARRTLATALQKKPDLVLDEVLLVGGSSRMPMIEASLENELGWTLHRTELDLAVAKGAAIYGSGEVVPEPELGPDGDPVGETAPRLGGGTSASVTVHNVLSRSLGVRFARQNPAVAGGWEPYIGFLAHANDSLPLDACVEAATLNDGTTEIAIGIYEQTSDVEHEDLSANREVTPETGAVLRGLPHLPADSPISFTLHIDSEGQARLSAYEPSTAQRIDMDVRLSVLQQEEVEAATALVSGMLTRRD